MRAYLSTTGDDKYVGTSGGGGGGGGGDNKDPDPTNFIFKKKIIRARALCPQLCFTMVAPGWC